MKKLTFKSILGSVSSFLLFFLTVGFIVSCCMMLFVSILADTMDLTITPDNVGTAAKVTFWNVVLITFLFKMADYIRRRIMVDRPTKIITDAAHGFYCQRFPRNENAPCSDEQLRNTFADTRFD